MKKLKILFLSSEVAPFAKTSGLADVSNSLPKALKELGHEVRIIMPKYKIINDRKFVLREVIRLKDIPISLGKERKKINVKSAFTPDPIKIQTYFIDYRPYFSREGLYVDPNNHKDYPDNDERFILFAKGVIETLKLLFWQPSIIHCNDWQTALLPFFLKTIYKDDPFFKKTSTVLTVHNVGYQGNFPAESFQKTNVQSSVFKPGSPVEYFGRFSFLKTGLYYTDYITTVSEQYAQEVQESEEYGFGFEGIFKERSSVFSGILNGIDYSVWSPDIDTHIPCNYSSGNLSGKKENKKALAEKFKLPFDEKIPVIGIISRLTDQKGFDIIGEMIESFVKMDMQMVILGTGERKYQKLFTQFHKNFPDRIGVTFKFDESLAHLIEAGSDMFLMPSSYEPCGLNQLFSLKYGTVPVVRKTGGLADTIQEFDPETGKGNGFVFEEYDPQALLNVLHRALEFYQKPNIWRKIMRNGMRQDFSWRVSAKKYYKVYENILKK